MRKSNLIRRAFKPWLKAAGLPSGTRFHGLHHTSVMLTLLQGTHAKVVQERLGHCNISMALDIYSDVLPSLDESTAGVFDALLKPKKAATA